jgi:hypothetical protein
MTASCSLEVTWNIHCNGQQGLWHLQTRDTAENASMRLRGQRCTTSCERVRRRFSAFGYNTLRRDLVFKTGRQAALENGVRPLQRARVAFILRALMRGPYVVLIRISYAPSWNASEAEDINRYSIDIQALLFRSRIATGNCSP